MKTIAFAGLGAMGLPMVKNLITAGYSVHGIDINPASLNVLSGMGGKAFTNAKEACVGADLLLILVVNASQAKQVLFESGAIDVLPMGGIACLMSTCPPAEVEEIAKQVQAKGRRLVDAPLSGGVVGATNGSLTVMAASDQKTFDDVQDVFKVIGERIFHVGHQPGQGAMCKAVNQLLCGLHIAVAAEAFSLAKKSGLDLAMLLEIMSGSAASSWMLKDRGPRMLESDPIVTSAVDIFVKDLGIVMQAGRDAKAALPLAAAAYQLFLSSSGRGEGRLDDSQVIRSYDLLNGLGK
jgi:3-hydroxyisobutyrate dehydrogenase